MDAQEISAQEKVMTQIIAFEGLSPLLFGVPNYVKRGLLDRVSGANIGLWRGGFMSNGPEPMVADRRIVIGHSMGGASAIAWANRYPKAHVDLLLTLDPRPLHRPYLVPNNVTRAVNFYRKSFWMRGYEVEGAKNIVVKCGHTDVPALADVFALMIENL